MGVTDPALARGGLKPEALPVHRSPRDITLLQRKPGKLGASLGKTTGWIHRASLKQRGVRFLGGVNYERIGDPGCRCPTASGGRTCAGWRWTPWCCAPARSHCGPAGPAGSRGVRVHIIGGAQEAGELDAKRAIDQGVRLGASL
jgi:2,4-dienoyl-CoA reductase (NADPH2)